MIKIILDTTHILQHPSTPTKIELFSVDVCGSETLEIIDAINGEINYNSALYDFGGLIYAR